MGKAQQTRKKIKWRREIKVDEPVETPHAFFVDSKADKGLREQFTGKYPEGFSKKKDQRNELTVKKHRPTVVPKKTAGNMFELWDGTQTTTTTKANPLSLVSHIPAVVAPHPG
jgi:hypothetical protein